MTSRLLAATALAALIAGAAHAAPATATAELKNSTGQAVGAVTLTEAPKGVLVRVEVKGLTPGWHGMHFHDKGDCSKSDFTSAGAHVHGSGTAVHGLLNPNANETGDLPNIHVDADGSGSTEAFSTLVKLADLRDADGSAVVIHANPDDHMAQPIGGSGARVACAVIK
jgi:superoxide dismutase, Cu-Zn family